MKNTVRKFLSLALAMIMVLGLAACGGDKSTGTTTNTNTNTDNTQQSEVVTSENNAADQEVVDTGSYKKELTIGCDEAFYSMDPGYSTGINQLTVHNLAHDGLVTIDVETNEIVGELAESWEWIDDVTIRWHLRQGVKFHDGSEMTASDVEFSLDHWYASSYLSSRVEWVDYCEVIDDYTIDFVLTDSAQDFIGYLTLSCYGIVSEAAVDDDPDEGWKIGCGPYMFREFVYGSHVTLDRFDDYYGELPKTETITFKYMPEASARIIALQTDELDICINPPAIELPTVETTAGLKLWEKVGGDTLQYLAVNIQNPKFNQNIRQAMAYAIDKEAVMLMTTEGRGEVANTFMGKAAFGSDSDAYVFEYNPEKARELLEQEGAIGLTVEIMAITNEKVLQAQAIQACLNAVGFDCQVAQTEAAAMLTATAAAEHDAVLYNWAGSPLGPDNVMRPLFNSTNASNRTKYADPELDQWIDEAMVEADTEKRAQMYSEMQTKILSEAAMIPLYFGNVYLATREEVQNLHVNGANIHEFAYVFVND